MMIINKFLVKVYNVVENNNVWMNCKHILKFVIKKVSYKP